ncbi:Ankyrin repeat and KH domain-containing protein [Penicillium chrysogenum]|uniref:Ankyrin repeat and KH domain-containing protein n=1 Tax=Penicillium chrysogenum TaxID=5076 RepID=A0A167WWJ7_PENCH|nr:Ankyrin repeat and KH domain-containing protein [Penicillium chrysogenum]
MADPLSIAAGIAGFLSLGIQVTQTLIEFYSAYKNQDTDVAKITRMIENLQSTFRFLQIAVQQRQAQANAEELLQKVDNTIQACHEIIQELQTECQKLHTDSITGLKGRFQVAGRRAAYPFRKSTIHKIEEDVGEIRGNLSFALNVLQYKSHNRIEDEISEVKYLLERTNTSQISLAIRAWLMAPDAYMNHHAIYAKHHPSTGLWFINGHHFANWLVERNSFLWLNGFAGCVGHGLLRALLLQLSVQIRDGEKELQQLHAFYKSSTPSVEILLQTLRGFLDRSQDSYILLDALDECPRDCGREDVLGVIQAIRGWRLPSVHLLVTSRDQLDIRESLNPSNCHDLSMKNAANDKDIADFVFDQLNHDTKLQRWKARHGEIQSKLIHGAQGVFRYVECQLNALRRARNRNQLDECLRSLPRDLDGTYERMLCSIDEIYVQDVQRIFTVLCLSVRPINVNELIDAHAVELGESPYLDREGRSYEQDDLVDICLGLIEIAVIEDDNGKPVSTARIAHFSVQEYLQSDRIQQQKAERFAIQSEPANTEMARICLAYLLDPALSCEILDEAKLQNFPFAHFAAMNWYHYYERCHGSKSKTETLVTRIFQDETNCFLTWVKLHDVDRPWNTKGTLERRADDIASPVYYAALLGLASVLKSILAVDSRTQRLSDTVNAQGGEFGNALQAASIGGHKNAVQILLDKGADVSAQGGWYSNALQAASFNGNKEVVQILLDRGADVNAQGGRYGNALQAASWRGHKEVVRILLDRGSDVKVQGGDYGNALHAASVGGHKEVVQILLDRGAKVNAQHGRYGNALQAASVGGYAEVVQVLLDRGADVNAQGGRYGNALQAASRRGHKEVVRMLLDRGSDVNVQGGDYGNALHAASFNGNLEVVRMLVDRGAYATTRSGGHKKVDMLLGREANLDAE